MSLLACKKRTVRQARFRPAGAWLGPLVLSLGLWVLAGCQSLPAPRDPSLGPRLDAAIRVLASPRSGPREQAQAAASYRALVAGQLPALLAEAARPGTRSGAEASGWESGDLDPSRYREIDPARPARAPYPGLHRPGLGLPAVGRIAPGGANAPRTGYRLPVTVLALPEADPAAGYRVRLVDPGQVRSVATPHGAVPVAMDLEAPLDAARGTGLPRGRGLVNLLRPERFRGPPRVIFLEPFDPDKRPLVLVHGLMSTPEGWAPLVKALYADPAIRAGFQVWFFYYPTGQPVPLSALQLREALDEAVRIHRPRHPMVLVGHSMGGILSRVQVSRLGVGEAAGILPGVADLPENSPVRRSLVFEPRTDVGRVVFMFTPHRGSRLATGRVGELGIRLIRLPETLLREMAEALEPVPQAAGIALPTSIQGLSPDSAFLRALDRTRPAVPTHSIIGDRGRGGGWAGSDGVVPYRSAHLPGVESELVVPAGHSGSSHPRAVAELRRILHQVLVRGAGGGACGAAPCRP